MPPELFVNPKYVRWYVLALCWCWAFRDAELDAPLHLTLCTSLFAPQSLPLAASYQLLRLMQCYWCPEVNLHQQEELNRSWWLMYLVHHSSFCSCTPFAQLPSTDRLTKPPPTDKYFWSQPHLWAATVGDTLWGWHLHPLCLSGCLNKYIIIISSSSSLTTASSLISLLSLMRGGHAEYLSTTPACCWCPCCLKHWNRYRTVRTSQHYVLLLPCCTSDFSGKKNWSKRMVQCL